MAEGVQPKDRILIDQLPFPQCEILAFGIWTLGASMVLTSEGDLDVAITLTKPTMTITSETDYFEKIKSFSEDHNPTFKPLLADEAMVFWDSEKGIQLSHYNLLVNANGIQHAIDLYEDQTYYTQLQPNSMAWVILQTMLPLYTGAPLTSDNPDMTLGTAADDFEIQWHWDTLDETSPPSLYTCNENTAFLSMNKMPIHLTAMNDDTRPSLISGHSVMMGYLEDSLNEKVFQKDALKIKAS